MEATWGRLRGRKSVALVSGGLDSLVSLAVAIRSMDVLLLIFFDYGQRAGQRERAAVTGIASYYEIPLREMRLEWMARLLPPAMATGKEAPAGKRGGVEAVWVPNRNGVFVNVAASLAESYGCEYVVTGFNREEAAEFPDNRREYVARVNRALSLSTLSGVKVLSFTQELSKKEIVRLGVELSAPLSLVWSCYLDGALMCGECPSCARFKGALESLPSSERPVVRFAA